MSADCGCGGTCPMCRLMAERLGSYHAGIIFNAAETIKHDSDKTPSNEEKDKKEEE